MPESALVVGAGSAGCATAILLARAGVTVDLVEVRHRVGASGSGITLQGNALRVLRELGVWEALRFRGHAFDDLGLRAPDGTLLAEVTDLRTGGDDLPATLGATRPDLTAILLARAEAEGVEIRFATSVTAVAPDGTAVLSDGENGRYDVVVGADGLRSRVRGLVGIPADPRSSGLGIWRVLTRRPAGVDRTDLAYGGPARIAGYCPTGPGTLYAYLAEDATDHSGLSPVEALETVRALGRGYGGAWPEIVAGMADPRGVHYTHAEHHVVDGPWHRGRVVLAGDAVHACPPTLAQGAAQALEDASVLVGELLDRTGTGPGTDDEVEAALTAYAGRRRPRATAVVDTSVDIARALVQGRTDLDVGALVARTARMLVTPP